MHHAGTGEEIMQVGAGQSPCQLGSMWLVPNKKQLSSFFSPQNPHNLQPRFLKDHQKWLPSSNYCFNNQQLCDPTEMRLDSEAWCPEHNILLSTCGQIINSVDLCEKFNSNTLQKSHYNAHRVTLHLYNPYIISIKHLYDILAGINCHKNRKASFYLGVGFIWLYYTYISSL